MVAADEVGAEVWALVGWGGDLGGVATAGAEEAEREEGEEDACYETGEEACEDGGDGEGVAIA